MTASTGSSAASKVAVHQASDEKSALRGIIYRIAPISTVREFAYFQLLYMIFDRTIVSGGQKAYIKSIFVEIWQNKRARPMAHVLLNIKWQCVFLCCLISTINCLRGQQPAEIGKRMSVLPVLMFFVELLAFGVSWRLLGWQVPAQQMFYRPVRSISSINRIDLIGHVFGRGLEMAFLSGPTEDSIFV